MKKRYFNLLVLLAGVSAGCGARNPSIPNDPLDISEIQSQIRTFPISTYPARADMISNTLFFWKTGFTSEQVSRVSANAKRINKLDDERKTLDPEVEKLTTQIDELNAVLEQIQGELDTRYAALKKANDQIAALDLEITRLKKRLEQAELPADEKKKLEDELSDDENQEAQQKSAIETLNQEISEFHAQKANVDSDVKDLECRRDIFLLQIKKIEDEFSLLLEQILSSANFFTLDIKMTIKVSPDGGIRIDIRNWDHDGLQGDSDQAVKDFSSKGANPAITNISYQERGGVLGFELRALGGDPGSAHPIPYTYKFRLERGKDDEGSKVSFPNGKVTRVESDGTERIGVAKFSSKRM